MGIVLYCSMRNFNSCFIVSLTRPSCSSLQLVPKCCNVVAQYLLLGPSPHACDTFNSMVPARIPPGPSPPRKTHHVPYALRATFPTAAPHAVSHEMTFPPAAAWGLQSPSKVSCRPKGPIAPDSPRGTCSLASSVRADLFEGISSYCQSCLDSPPIDHICPCVHLGCLIQLPLTCPYSITLAALRLRESPQEPFFPSRSIPSGTSLPSGTAAALAFSYSFNFFKLLVLFCFQSWSLSWPSPAAFLLLMCLTEPIFSFNAFWKLFLRLFLGLLPYVLTLNLPQFMVLLLFLTRT